MQERLPNGAAWPTIPASETRGTSGKWCSDCLCRLLAGLRESITEGFHRVVAGNADFTTLQIQTEWHQTPCGVPQCSRYSRRTSALASSSPMTCSCCDDGKMLFDRCSIDFFVVTAVLPALCLMCPARKRSRPCQAHRTGKSTGLCGGSSNRRSSSTGHPAEHPRLSGCDPN